MNNKKVFAKFFFVIIAVIVISLFIYVRMGYRAETIPNSAKISSDGKKIINRDGEIILELVYKDLDKFYKLMIRCDAPKFYPDVAEICKNEEALKEKFLDDMAGAKFDNVEIASTKQAIAFTIMSATGDRFVGILSTPDSEDLFLGTASAKILGFSPSGKYLAYQHGCFEGECAISIFDNQNKNQLPGPSAPSKYGESEYLIKFSKWISDDEILYYKINYGGKILGESVHKITSGEIIE